MKKLKPQSFIEISILFPAGTKKARSTAVALFAGCGIPAEEIVFFETPEDFRAAVYTRRSSLLNRIRAEFKKKQSPGGMSSIKGPYP